MLERSYKYVYMIIIDSHGICTMFSVFFFIKHCLGLVRYVYISNAKPSYLHHIWHSNTAFWQIQQWNATNLSFTTLELILKGQNRIQEAYWRESRSHCRC